VKLPNLVVVLFAILPLTACAKSQEEMCADMTKHVGRVALLEVAPLNANKEMIELRFEQFMDSNVFKDVYNKCVNNKNMTKQQYECVMKAKTSRAGKACGF